MSCSPREVGCPDSASLMPVHSSGIYYQEELNFLNFTWIAQQCTMILEGQRTVTAINRQFRRAEKEKKFNTHAFCLARKSYEWKSLVHMHCLNILHLFFGGRRGKGRHRVVENCMFAAGRALGQKCLTISTLQKSTPNLGFLDIYTHTNHFASRVMENWKTACNYNIFYQLFKC